MADPDALAARLMGAIALIPELDLISARYSQVSCTALRPPWISDLSRHSNVS